MIRSSTHFDEQGTYFHFMYKKNVSDINKPYVAKLESGSGRFETVHDFLEELGIVVDIQRHPVLYAEMERETAIIRKDRHMFLISFDNVEYRREFNGEFIGEKMLEIEDWTNPNTILNYGIEDDAHLLAINELLLSDDGLPLRLTTHSKPIRGFTIFGERGFI